MSVSWFAVISPLLLILVITGFFLLGLVIKKFFIGGRKPHLKEAKFGQAHAAFQPVSEERKVQQNMFWTAIKLVGFFGVALVLIVLIVSVVFTFEPVPIETAHAQASISPVESWVDHSDGAIGYVSKPIRRRHIDPGQQIQRIEKWKNDLPFPADQYSDVESCAIPLAQKVHNELNAGKATRPPTAEAVEKLDEQTVEKDSVSSNPHTILVNVDNLRLFQSEYATPFFKKFEAAYKALDPKAKVVANTEKKKNADYECEVKFSLTETKTFQVLIDSSRFTLRKGKVLCELLMKETVEKSRAEKFTTKFTETPWLQKDFSGLGLDRFHVGLSFGLEESESRAHELAILDLAKTLEISPDDIEAFNTKSFRQKIKRPYGTVYREAVLVDLGLVLEAHKQSQAGVPLSTGEQVVKSLEIDAERGIAVLAFMTIALAFIANIATQGYYRTGLSRTAIVISSLAVIFIILIVILNLA